MPIIGDIASTTSGIDSATPIHKPRVEIAQFGIVGFARARDRHQRHAAFRAVARPVLQISGCMGQV